MKHPNIIRLTPEWVSRLDAVHTQLPDGRWVPARPIGFGGLHYRCRAAWMVFTGRADALLWPDEIARQDRESDLMLGEQPFHQIIGYLILIGDLRGALKYVLNAMYGKIASRQH